MKNTYMTALALALLLAFSVPKAAFAATAGPATGSVTAVIISPLTLAHTPAASLNFGTTVSGTAGTVTVAAKDGSATNSGVTQQIGPTTADQFTVTGAAGINFTVTVPANGSVTVTDGASHTMAISNFTSFCGTGATSSCVTTALPLALSVGGTLNVTAGQATGAYTGTYPLSITY